MKSAGRIFIESAEAWDTLISLLRDPRGTSVKIPLPEGDEALILEFADRPGILFYSFEPKKRRGRAMPVSDRSEQN